jgi:hypothetical protein
MGVILLAAAPARAADITDVASSFDEGNRFDFRFRFSYQHTEKRAQVKRELEGLPAQDTIEVRKDLVYSSYRDAIAFRAEFGLFHDLMLHFELPLVISEQASLGFDQSAGSGCIFPPASNPNCVNEMNSTTLADGILMPGGFNGAEGGRSFAPPSSEVFRGAQRGARGGGSGLDVFDTFNIGLTWAPLSQARDDTKPTWSIGVQFDASIGNIKRFDRAQPNANHAVSEGVHRFWARTDLSKRFKYLDPYIGFWYMLPIPRSDSLFIDYGSTQKHKNPAMQGGTRFGLEIVPIERPAQHYKFAIDLSGRIEGHFLGRGYSEIWEMLASAPPLDCTPATSGFNPACDPAAPGGRQNAYQGKPFDGVTLIQNYATVGAGAALTGQIGPYVRLKIGFDYTHDQSHNITGDDIGTPKANGTGRVMAPDEFNPAYRAVIDQVGRRYVVDNVNVYDVWFYGQVMF